MLFMEKFSDRSSITVKNRRYFKLATVPLTKTKENLVMLGLGDGCVLAAVIGTVAITLVCVVFGAINWNSGTGDEKK